MKTAVIIGSGNVATNFAEIFQQVGMEIVAVYSKHQEHAASLAEVLNSNVVSQVKDIPVDADLYFIAVNDSAIQDISEQLDANGMVVHCSGFTSIKVLSKHQSYGVMWPVQTISKNILPDFATMPICIEGSDDQVHSKLKVLASKISGYVVAMDSEQRKYAHLAAVISNNLSNHLYEISCHILEQHGMSFNLLRPIIKENAHKLQLSKPSETQTGPAIRNDQETMRKHVDMLSDHPRYQEIYQIISTSIIERNKLK